VICLRTLTAAVCKEVGDRETGVTISTLNTDSDEDFELAESQKVSVDGFSEGIVSNRRKSSLESLNSIQSLIDLLSWGGCLVGWIDTPISPQIRMNCLVGDEVLGEGVDIDAVLFERVAGLYLSTTTAVVIGKKVIEIFDLAVET
jgi:hypothetical protein